MSEEEEKTCALFAEKMVLTDKPLKPSKRSEADETLVKAIRSLDKLDKKLNADSRRVQEWYGLHFPELAKILEEAEINQDFVPYAKVVKRMGRREDATKHDFSDILPEDIEQRMKEASVASMGVEISDEKLLIVDGFCDLVISLSELKLQLHDSLKSTMNTIAPNLTTVVGELVGARLLARAGSLLNLAKKSGKKIQILGAEKALLRALKSHGPTPKHGFIFHASLVSQAKKHLKGKISRSLAAKAALAIRCDAFGEGQDNSMGLKCRAKLEERLRSFEKQRVAEGMNTHAEAYNPASDAVLGSTPEARAMIKEECGAVQEASATIEYTIENIWISKF